MNQIMNNLSKGLFLLAAVVLAIVYYLYQRRGRTINQLIAEGKKQLIVKELINIREQSQKGEYEYKKAMERYQLLKLKHGELLKQLGIFTGQDKPSERGH